jgi:hydrophobic/amphiphilic exporter-1 (mainly G- bacteria), HAE1 family
VSKLFINRPIVAIVIAILMTIIGGVCILGLPIAQFPNIVPEIQVRTHYTGADAQTIEQSVAAPIEQQMSGVDNMNYMYSINANNGDMRLTVNLMSRLIRTSIRSSRSFECRKHLSCRRTSITTV